MLKRRPYLYLGIAALFAVAVVLIERPFAEQRGDLQRDLLLPGFAAEKVGKVEAEYLISGIQLEREGETWKVAKLPTRMEAELAAQEARELPAVEWFPADAARVNALLGTFGDLSRGMLVSSNPEKQMEYNVGALGQKLRFLDREGKPIGALIIGKNGPDFISNYVRLEDSNEVYLIDRSLRGIVSAEVEDMKQKEESPDVTSAAEAPTP